jgi:hypothetical protein
LSLNKSPLKKLAKAKKLEIPQAEIEERLKALA